MLRNNSKCMLCPLNGHQKVRSQEVQHDGCHLAIIGEAPGVAEENKGFPFAGPSGRILNMALAQNEIIRQSLWITNTISCRPHDNKIESPEGWGAVKCCHSGLMEELEVMRKSGITTLLTLGQTATEAVLGKDIGKISTVRGSVYEENGFYVIPAYHPAFVLRAGGKRDGVDGISLVASLTEDIGKAFKIAKDGWKPLEEHFNVDPSRKDIDLFAEEMMDIGTPIALDIETTGLNAHKGAQEVVVGLGKSDTEALVVPFLTLNGVPRWSLKEHDEVQHVIEKLLDHNGMITQNGFFDIPFLRTRGWSINPRRLEYDTLVVHSLVAPEEPHNLAYITSIFGKTKEWKSDFHFRTMPILKMDQIEMRTYNARDCVVLHQVLPPMLELLEEYNLIDFYNEETKPLMVPFMEMNETGVGFDFKHLEAFSKKMDELIEGKKGEMYAQFNLPSEFKVSSDDQLRWYVFGEEPNCFDNLEAVKVTTKKTLKSGKEKESSKLFPGFKDLKEIPKAKLPADPITSWSLVKTLDEMKPSKARDDIEAVEKIKNMQRLFRLNNYKGLQTEKKKTKVSSEGFLSYTIALQNRLDALSKLVTKKPEEEEAIENVLLFLEQIGEYGVLEKLKSSFTSYEPDSDGRIRPNWQMHGTATGRLSCKSPNLAQLPNRGMGSEVREFFVARDGHRLIDADCVNLEVALLGWVARDKIITNIYESGGNIHDENTKILFPYLTPSDELWESGRSAAKVFQFGGLSYGGTPMGIYRRVVMKAPKLHLTFAAFCDAMDNWMSMHPDYVKWREEVEQTVLTKRRLYTCFGRMRIFLGAPSAIVREGMNFMIQSPGSSVINRAMIRIKDRIDAEKMETKIIMQVYDEITLEAPNDEVDTAQKILVEELERPFAIYGVQRHVRVEAGNGKTFKEAHQ